MWILIFMNLGLLILFGYIMRLGFYPQFDICYELLLASSSLCLIILMFNGLMYVGKERDLMYFFIVRLRLKRLADEGLELRDVFPEVYFRSGNATKEATD